MDPISIASLVASGIKGIGGLIQGGIGARKQRNLWEERPMLGVTEGEKANDNLYRQMAASVEMPGQKQFESKLGETYAEGVQSAQQGAISSLGAQQSAVDLAGKKMEAIRDLAGTFAEYKERRKEALGQWNQQSTELEQQRFQVNQYEPWGIKMNEATGQKQAGFGAAGQGIDQGLGMLGNLAGTNAYMKILQEMQKVNGLNKGNTSSPLKNTYSPQDNLMNTLKGLVPKPNISW